MRETMKVVVSGVCQGKPFNTPITFTLVPPGVQNYYGNGHYMNVHLPDTSKSVDVRYAQTTDLKKLARIWLADYYGDDLKSMQITGGDSNVRY